MTISSSPTRTTATVAISPIGVTWMLSPSGSVTVSPGERELQAAPVADRGAKARLIANGTYNADGTVNLDTAKRLGWDKIWAQK